MSVHEQHAPTHLSESGARFIARFEGFRAHLYNDAARLFTAGEYS
jgi:GH24 family phage-related lysozyme (muramidase)